MSGKTEKTDVDEQIAILKRGVAELISEEGLRAKLQRGRPLRVKAGFDPTTADLHLGHTVVIEKLRQFQELGHEVFFLIGDFTASIGDPSGQSRTRPRLGSDKVEANAATYARQAFKILDRTRTRVVKNSSWMSAMSAAELTSLAGEYTVARMLEREDFSRRYKQNEAVSLHEFLYPLIQGYDSVVLEADVEVGGTDQKFNLLVGRELQRHRGKDPQAVLTLPLLEGLDGKRKMSKSFGNAVPIDVAAGDMYGMLMSISDELMLRYYELLSEAEPVRLEEVRNGELHPMEAKKALACELVGRYHGDRAAADAQVEFERRFQGGGLPDEVDEFNWTEDGDLVWICRLLKEAGLAASAGEARRLIRQGGVRLEGERVEDEFLELPCSGRPLLQVGKRRVVRIRFGGP